MHILVSGSLPWSMSSNATSVVIILAMEAGGIRTTAFLASSSVPANVAYLSAKSRNGHHVPDPLHTTARPPGLSAAPDADDPVAGRSAGG